MTGLSDSEMEMLEALYSLDPDPETGQRSAHVADSDAAGPGDEALQELVRKGLVRTISHARSEEYVLTLAGIEAVETPPSRPTSSPELRSSAASGKVIDWLGAKTASRLLVAIIAYSAARAGAAASEIDTEVAPAVVGLVVGLLVWAVYRLLSVVLEDGKVLAGQLLDQYRNR